MNNNKCLRLQAHLLAAPCAIIAGTRVHNAHTRINGASDESKLIRSVSTQIEAALTEIISAALYTMPIQLVAKIR